MRSRITPALGASHASSGWTQAGASQEMLAVASNVPPRSFTTHNDGARGVVAADPGKASGDLRLVLAVNDDEQVQCACPREQLVDGMSLAQQSAHRGLYRVGGYRRQAPAATRHQRAREAVQARVDRHRSRPPSAPTQRRSQRTPTWCSTASSSWSRPTTVEDGPTSLSASGIGTIAALAAVPSATETDSAAHVSPPASRGSPFLRSGRIEVGPANVVHPTETPPRAH